MMKKKIVYRPISTDAIASVDFCTHKILASIYYSRGVTSTLDLEKKLSGLYPFHSMLGIEQATNRLYIALQQQQKIMIIGDYDTDGATSTAIAVRALRSFGAQQVEYLIPNRFDYGYGLSPEIVRLAHKKTPDLIITVDNGIVSFEGTDLAKKLGIDVIITDHHLAGDRLPDVCAIVNPNQPNDAFPSKNLAGCGVIFYLLLALRAKLRQEGWFVQQNRVEPSMLPLTDLVALGTVADVVPLDKNNRILVHHGIERIRQGKCIPGIKVLLELGKRRLTHLIASDLAYSVAPRLNAAGRLEDMSLGVECLLTDERAKALEFATRLDSINLERQVIEAEMKEQAFARLEDLDIKIQAEKLICLYSNKWHQGVIGILASRIKDHYHRPVVIFADGDVGEIKGSARSIIGLHIRDAFERVALTHPGLLLKYGGHAMAAGLTVAKQNFEQFKEALTTDIEAHLQPEDLENKLLCDAQLAEEDFNIAFAKMLREAGPWGQGFPEPLFANQFNLLEQRLVGEKHLKLTLGFKSKIIDGILFNADLVHWPNHRCEQVLAVYRLDVNEYQGRKNLQLMIDYLEPV